MVIAANSHVVERRNKRKPLSLSLSLSLSAYSNVAASATIISSESRGQACRDCVRYIETVVTSLCMRFACAAAAVCNIRCVLRPVASWYVIILGRAQYKPSTQIPSQIFMGSIERVRTRALRARSESNSEPPSVTSALFSLSLSLSCHTRATTLKNKTDNEKWYHRQSQSRSSAL